MNDAYLDDELVWWESPEGRVPVRYRRKASTGRYHFVFHGNRWSWTILTVSDQKLHPMTDMEKLAFESTYED